MPLTFCPVSVTMFFGRPGARSFPICLHTHGEHSPACIVYCCAWACVGEVESQCEGLDGPQCQVFFVLGLATFATESGDDYLRIPRRVS